MKLFIFAALATGASAPAFAQTTWIVDAAAAGPGSGTAADPYASIQFAIDAVGTVPGDTLEIRTGTYPETVNLSGKDLVLDGTAADPVPVIDAQQLGSALTFATSETSACVIRGLALTGGSGTVQAQASAGGGALISGASPTFVDVLFEGNRATIGGGAAVENGDPTFQGCRFKDNESEGGGGLYVAAGSVVISGGTFENNSVDAQTSSGFGGGVFVAAGSTATVAGTVFTGNQTLSFGGGGGLYVELGASANLAGCDFLENMPGLFVGPGSGGGIYARGDVTCSLSRFVGNGSLEPDGVFGGGGARGGDYVDCVFEGNWGQLGGGLRDATATGCTFIGNVGCADGSGRGGAAEDCTLIDCLLKKNVACGQGGGAYDGELEGCEVIENMAVESDSFQSDGGGIHSADAENTLLRGNVTGPASMSSPPSRGGGAFNSDLDGCIVIGNRAAIGGGMAGGSAERTTIVGNFADFSNGGTSSGSYDSSLVWHNFPAGSVNGGQFSYSNVEGGVPAGTGNLSSDPGLVEPSGADVHLIPGSPSIDTGSPTLPLDPDGTRADMGALPYDSLWTTASASFCRSTETTQGCHVELIALSSASLSGGLTLTAAGAPPLSFGLFFVGPQPNHRFVPSPVPTRPNTLCIGGAVTRTSIAQSSPSQNPCGGVFSIDVTPAQLVNAGAQVGGALYGQLWFRDPGAAGARTAMSSGVYLPIAP